MQEKTISIAEMAKHLEDAVNAKLIEFEKLGKALRQMAHTKKPTKKDNECMDRLYMGMAAIVKELMPVNYFIFKSNPNCEELFESLATISDAAYQGAQEENKKLSSRSAKRQMKNKPKGKQWKK